MKFMTSCFVRVEDVDMRNKLIRWCEDIIGRNGGHTVGADWITGEYVLCMGDITFCCRYAELILLMIDNTIDCGENIELFKALAAMNDWNDIEQYFVTELAGSSYCVHKGRNENIEYYITCRKATTEEIIEYFNRKLP